MKSKVQITTAIPKMDKVHVEYEQPVFWKLTYNILMFTEIYSIIPLKQGLRDHYQTSLSYITAM